MPRINPLERRILLSADEQGRISLAQSGPAGADKFRKILGLLEKLRVLHLDPANNCYRLTVTGRRLKATLRTHP